jgi:hypothetical protein
MVAIMASSVPGEVGVFVDRDEDQARRPVRVPELAGTNHASPPRKEALKWN